MRKKVVLHPCMRSHSSMFQQVNLHGDIMQEITSKKYGYIPPKQLFINANLKSVIFQHKDDMTLTMLLDQSPKSFGKRERN